MCGRYHFGIKQSELGKKIKEHAEKLNLVFKEGEIFPSDNVLCVIPYETNCSLDTKKWGIKGRNFQINARIESINDSLYDLNKFNRCAVLCNGFYEWDENKNKYYISFKQEYMYLACIFNKDNELLIITEPSYGSFKSIHDRVPVIMDKNEMLNYIHSINCKNIQKELNINKITDVSSIL